jgi:hypothetical protein
MCALLKKMSCSTSFSLTAIRRRRTASIVPKIGTMDAAGRLYSKLKEFQYRSIDIDRIQQLWAEGLSRRSSELGIFKYV